MRYLSTKLLLCLLALTAYSPANGKVTVTDDFGMAVSLERAAARIVSLAPGATEMLFAAGAGPRIAATVEFAVDPPAARTIPRIGDANAIDLERLSALKPDVVVVWPGGNSPAQIEQIVRLGMPVYRHRVDVLADLPAAVRRLGALAGTPAPAEAAARDLTARLARLERHYGPRASFAVLVQVWGRPIYTVGGTQLISDALRVCGARNVFADLRELSPAVETEAVIARDPDLIIAVGPAEAAAEWLNGWRRFTHLRAVRSGGLIAFDDQRLTRLGPSALTATESLCRVIDAARRRPANTDSTLKSTDL